MRTSKIIYICLLSLYLGACAAKQLKINSEPPGADVLVNEASVGITPLTLNSQQIQSTLQTSDKGELVKLTLRKDGFEDSHLIIKPTGIETYSINLKSIDNSTLRKIPKNYSGQVNEISRELLSIQGLLFSRNSTDAKTKLDSFNEKFPNIAATFVLYASVDTFNNNLEGAYGKLLQAQKLDPNDLQIQKMLAQLEKKIKGENK